VGRADATLARGVTAALHWHALRAAHARDGQRLDFCIDAHGVGSVAREHLAVLQALNAPLQWHAQRITLAVPADERTPVLAALNLRLRDAGLIRAWRDEVFPLLDLQTLQPLAHIERAAARFWGTLTLGAHATGYVAGPDGRPEALWIARRSPTKATDPGLYDNLIGGGVPAQQSPAQALVREGWEEAGLTPAQMHAARPGRVMRLWRDIPEGLMLEDLYSFDLQLPAGLTPCNQDGEVAGFELMPVPRALDLARSEQMTVDAALVTLDFALRHGLLPPDEAPALSAALAPLLRPTSLST